jgi:HPt (histidine-containing phosphotransfer) domain-containing protein
MNDFISKPVDLGRLSEVIAQWLARPDPHDPAAVPQENAEAIFDSAALLERLMGDRPLAGAIVQGFVGDVPSQLKTLCERLAAMDGPAVRVQAHALKGAAATVAAGRLRAIALEMERAAGAGELDHAGALLPRVIEEFEQLKTTLAHAGWL